MKSLLFPSCLALAVSAALADGVLINHTMPPAQLLHLDGTPVDGVSASASPGELIEKAGLLPCLSGETLQVPRQAGMFR